MFYNIWLDFDEEVGIFSKVKDFLWSGVMEEVF